MTQEKLKKTLEAHKHWILEDVDGWETMRADLDCEDLRGANLQYADLRYVDLKYADLRGANLQYADLQGVNLQYADLRGANLKYANFQCARLWCANLNCSDLEGANFREADLWNVELCGAKNIPFIPLACPEKGPFVAYKKAQGLIVELLIPYDARRSSATTRKCRANKAKVLGIQKTDGSPAIVTEVVSNWDREFVYRVGETVEVDNFDDNRWNECSTGIHFFMSRQEAVEY